MILEFSGEEKAGMKEIPQRAEDIVEPFNERSIYSIGNFSFESNINFLLSLKWECQLDRNIYIHFIVTLDHASTNQLYKAHDNFAYEHTSFDPQVGGVLFQGNKEN